MSNQRQSRRVPLDVYLNKFIRGVPHMARAKDISPEGIYLTQLIEPSGREDRVGLQFQLPGTTEVIYAEGRIVRDATRGRARGNGIRFTLMTERHRELIARFVRQHASRRAA